MNDDIRTWDEYWEDDYAPTIEEVRRSVLFWSAMKARGIHLTIVTPYCNIVDGKYEFKQPSNRHFVTAEDLQKADSRPFYLKRKKQKIMVHMRLAKNYKAMAKRADYMGDWVKRGRRFPQ